MRIDDEWLADSCFGLDTTVKPVSIAPAAIRCARWMKWVVCRCMSFDNIVVGFVVVVEGRRERCPS
jgi:hypothetical protein